MRPISYGYFGAGLLGLAHRNWRAHFSGSVEAGRDYRFDRTRRVNPTKYRRESYELGFGIRQAGHEFGFTYDKKDTGHTGTPACENQIWYSGLSPPAAGVQRGLSSAARPSGNLAGRLPACG